MATHDPIYIPGNARWIIAGIALSLLVIACCLPAFYDSKGDAWNGFNVLWCGVFAILIGQLGWLANVFAAAAMVTLALGWQKTTIFLSAVAACTGLLSFTLLFATIPLDEGMVNKVTCTGFGLGFYFWMASLATPGLGTIFVLPLSRG